MAALSAAGMRVDPDLLRVNSFDPDLVPAAILGLLALPEPPDAIFAANDMMAAEALLVLRAQGVRVPEEIAVV